MSRCELIVMLTHNDYTIENALEIFALCQNTPVQYWGAKEQGIPRDELKKLYAAIKAAGKRTALEVVAYDEASCINGALLAAECGCDLLLGTVFFDSVLRICKENSIRYMPFIGEVSQRPSILNGDLNSMLDDAGTYLNQGVDGFDLLGYRYSGDGYALSKGFVTNAPCPVCLAGGINSYDRLKEVREISPAFFTIGGAFWDLTFGADYAKAIADVCQYMEGVLC